MGSNGVRLPENSLYQEYPEYQEYQDDVWITDLDVLKIAKARQDLIHQKLDKWIAAAIAELTNPTPPDRYAASEAEDLRRRHRQALEALSLLIVDGAGNGGPSQPTQASLAQHQRSIAGVGPGSSPGQALARKRQRPL